MQLGGEPDFAPGGLSARSRAAYDASSNLRQMLSANLVSERIAVEADRQTVDLIGDKDAATRRMLKEILRDEEEHADELKDSSRLETGTARGRRLVSVPAWIHGLGSEAPTAPGSADGSRPARRSTRGCRPAPCAPVPS